MIARAFMFLNWLLMAGLAAVIVLMILRVISTAADLNPFSWAAITIRRLSEPLTAPVRRAMMAFGVDPKFAPFIVILMALLLAFGISEFLAALGWTVEGLITSVLRGAVIAGVGFILYGLVAVYILMIFVRIILSYAVMGYSNRLMRFLFRTTEPLLAPLRRTIPPLGQFDVSPIVAFLILWVCQRLIVATLLRNAGSISMGMF